MRKNELKRDRTTLVRELETAGATFNGNALTCPYHDDQHASAGIFEGKTGWFFKCQTCSVSGDVIDIMARNRKTSVGDVLKSLDDSMRPRSTSGMRNANTGESARNNGQSDRVFKSLDEVRQSFPGPVETQYHYAHPDTGNVELIVIRIKTPDGKTFRQVTPVNGGYAMKAPSKPWPLYNRTRIMQADTIVVVEGEKCVHALAENGIVATTSPCGAGKAEHADWRPLAGKNVILWPDNDEKGHNHIRQVEVILEKLNPPPRISLIDPDTLELGHKEDAADLVEQLKAIHGDNAAAIQRELMEALHTARPRGPAAGVLELIEDTIAGKRQAIPWPWELVGGLTKALLPGTVTLICGSPGASKSFMLLQAAMSWVTNQIAVALYELEESREYHLNRALAQMADISDLTDPEWIRGNPDAARQAYHDHSKPLEALAQSMYASPETMPTLKKLVLWIQDRAKSGARIIAIDPVTAAVREGDPWVVDNNFLNCVKQTAVEYDLSVVLVTHPTKNFSGPDVNQLAGSAAYARFAQTILWLKNHDNETSSVMTSLGTTNIEHNRTLHILKARNGRGQGVRLAMQFSPDSLKLAEFGIITKGG